MHRHGNPHWISVAEGRVVALVAQDLDLHPSLPQVLPVVHAVLAQQDQGAMFPGRRSALARTMGSRVIIPLDVK